MDAGDQIIADAMEAVEKAMLQEATVLRDGFAGAFMQILITNPNDSTSADALASKAYTFADAMLRARSRRG